MKLLRYAFKAYWVFRTNLLPYLHTAYTKLLLAGNDAEVGSGLRSFGIPLVNVSLGGKLRIGRQVTMRNGKYFALTGRAHQCQIAVGKDGLLEIGDGVGISSATLLCFKSIHIGNHVLIGNNTAIYDSDLHSLDAEQRKSLASDRVNATNRGIVIEDNVFIGAHCTILKGVTIGHNSIVAACSVVTKSIPSNQIWGGNPARFIRYNEPVHEAVSL